MHNAQFNENDGLPHLICFVCEKRIIDAITLRQQAAETFACLSAMISKAAFLESDTKSTIVEQTVQRYVIVHEQFDDDDEYDDGGAGSADEVVNLDIESCDGGNAGSYFAKSNNAYEYEAGDDADDILDEPSAEEVDSDEVEDAVMLQFKRDLLVQKQGDGKLRIKTEKSHKKKKFGTAETATSGGGEEERRHLCNVCQKKFLRRSNLIDHLRLHANERLFKCSFCDKAFVQAGNLKAHMRVHTKERPYECQLCNKTYNQSGALKVHYRSHTNERNYKCDDCTKAFTNASDLKKHQRVHNPDLMFKCEHCERRFAQRGNLRVHVTNNHGPLLAIRKSEIDSIH